MSVKTIMFEIEGLIKNTFMSCASLYGFSAEEALAKIDANGNLIKAVIDKKAEKQKKDAEKAEKQRAKEAEKEQKDAEKALIKQQKEAEKQRAKEAEKEQKDAEKALIKHQKEAEKVSLKQQKEAEKAELASMKEEEILSKAAEKLFLKQKKEGEKAAEKKTKKVKKIAVIEPTPVIKSASEDDEPFIRFQNIPLMNEINSILNVKKFKNHKKLSAGVNLARQILDI